MTTSIAPDLLESTHVADHSPYPPADVTEIFLLMGGIPWICRNSEFIYELRRQGVQVGIVAPESFRDQYEASRLATPCLRAVASVEFVPGDEADSGTFTSGTLDTIRRLTARYSIVGVLAISEHLVEQAGLVCDVLGLPGVGFKASRIARSKFLQRTFGAAISPASEMYTAKALAAAVDTFECARFPAIVKPAGRHGSEGVLRVDNRAALRSALDQYGADEIVLVEEEVVGPEYSVESLVFNGNIVFSSVTAKETNELTGRFVELSHTVPSPDLGMNDILLAANRQLIATMCIEDGIVHAEFKCSGAVPRLMEFATRVPGDAISVLYRLATGDFLERKVLDIVLDREPPVYEVRGKACQVYLDQECGTYAGIRITDDALAAIPQFDISDGGEWPRFDHQPVNVDTPAGPAQVWGVLVSKKGTLTEIEASWDRAASAVITADSFAALAAAKAWVRRAVTVAADME